MELICQKLLLSLSYFFTARRSYASAVLRVVILLVCLSVRLSVKRVLCDKTKQYTADILIPHARVTPTVVGGRCPLPSEICAQKRRLRQISAYNVSTVKDCEKSSIMVNKKSTTGFPTSYRWSAYVTSKYLKGGSKSDFFQIKFNFIRTKSATKFLF